MNILHVIPGDLWAGAEAQVYYTLKELNKSSQNNISVILFNKGELYKRLLDAGVETIHIDEESNGVIAICIGIKQQLISRDVDVIHVHEYKSHIITSIANILIGKKCPLFRTIHGENVPSRLKSYFILGVQKVFIRYLTDHIIAVSMQIQNQLLKKQTRAKVHLLYNAVELDVIPLGSVSTIRKLFCVKNQQLWIGTAARLEQVKNLEMLIEAARILRNKHSDISFRISIFGEGILRKELEKKIMQYDLSEVVVLEGHIKNILPVLNALDIFTLTSLNEGMPMSLLEAMSVGTVTVCTAVGGIKEVITHNEDGFLVPSANVEKLAEYYAVIYKKGGKLNSLRLNAKEKIRNNFSLKQNCFQLLLLYKSAL